MARCDGKIANRVSVSYKTTVQHRRLNILITAGPTIEPIDPVRFISNRSSGKMGYAMAQSAIEAGHRVTLVSGPVQLTPPRGCRCVPVTTASEMRQAVLKHFKAADVLIKTAAVADYRIARPASRKIKKTGKTLTLKLVRNPDILAAAGRKKRRDQIVVGFAAETNNAICNAMKKIRAKNLDWIVLNDVAKKGIGFESDKNAVTVLNKSGVKHVFAKQDKLALARRIMGIIS